MKNVCDGWREKRGSMILAIWVYKCHIYSGALYQSVNDYMFVIACSKLFWHYLLIGDRYFLACCDALYAYFLSQLC